MLVTRINAIKGFHLLPAPVLPVMSEHIVCMRRSAHLHSSTLKDVTPKTAPPLKNFTTASTSPRLRRKIIQCCVKLQISLELFMDFERPRKPYRQRPLRFWNGRDILDKADCTLLGGIGEHVVASSDVTKKRLLLNPANTTLPQKTPHVCAHVVGCLDFLEVLYGDVASRIFRWVVLVDQPLILLFHLGSTPRFIPREPKRRQTFAHEDARRKEGGLSESNIE